MPEDIAARADDYERRLAAAGSTDSIIEGLVAGAGRSRRTIRLLAVSLLLDIVLSFGMAGLALVAWNNAGKVQRNSMNIQMNVRAQCEVQNTAAVNLNTVLDTLIEFARVSPAFPPKERAARVKKYTDVKAVLPVCKPLM